ncbi:FAD-binding oxidoreductase [Promicromonospora thailandica]|uniref:Ferredoxin-NADP reductase n=1 Tax=Promicromonospora thailandica TaxID=765201 RepID=A0A9X2FZB5_9MICO|nr:FAD-binding oxidoreductase [Promicromonospora thailandica]MCP2263240.1 Ferredoxin-NADP reductase [Promicromonospora thailandica]BFF18629.1 ferredoxin reductase [Promicromonospora thailandica]
MRARPAWHVATVTETRQETPTAARLVLDVPTWPGSVAGAHLDVRLTAPDGYQASRSYSIAASAPAAPGTPGRVVLAVDEVPDGEVSPFLVHDVRVGDQLELHGPLGAFFVWRPGEDDRPVQLVGGGSGVVPLYAMAAAHGAAGDETPFRLLYSVRTPADVYFADELAALAGPSFTLDLVWTRKAPDDRPGPVGRLTRESLAALTVPADQRPRVFVCGSTGFVETVAAWLQELGHAADDIHTERFGGLT